MKDIPTTIDGILNRRLMLEQPAKGYRIAVDTVLLAAAVQGQAGDRVLDMGCGVGGALLALAYRVPGIVGVGLEIQPDLVDLCRRNIARNALPAELTVTQGSVEDLPDSFCQTFDHVLMNPPYHEESRHDVSPNSIKRTANTEKQGDLKLWIKAAASALKAGGVLTLIHRADRRDEILSLLAQDFGDLSVLCLLPKEGAEAKRILIRARKEDVSPRLSEKRIILHQAEGAYTNEIEGILRNANALIW